MSFFYLNMDLKTTDRMDIAKFFNFTDNIDVLTSKFIFDLKSLSQAGTFQIQGQEGRPDLISQEVYRTTQYWWVILFYNSVLDTDSLKQGDSVSYPSQSDIDALVFSLKAQEVSRGKI